MVGKLKKKKNVEPRRSDGCTVKIEKYEMKEWTATDLRKLEKRDKLYRPHTVEYVTYPSFY